MIEKLKSVLAALEASQQFVEASSNAKLHPGWGSQLDEAEVAITNLQSVIAEMEAGEPVAWMHRSNDMHFMKEKPLGEIGFLFVPLYDHPQPKAEPTKCVKCGDELMSSFTSTCYACNQKAK